MRRIKNAVSLLLLMLSVSVVFMGCSNYVDEETTTSAQESTIAPEKETTEDISTSEESAESSTSGESAELSTSETPTEALIEESTEAPAETPTEVPTEAPTEVPTEAPTEASTEAPTEVPTEAPTEAPHVHEWSEWKTETAATCTKDGVRTRSCSCGSTENEAISATGHNYQNGVCSCGAREYAGIFATVENIQLTNCYWSNGKIITGRTTQGDFMFDSSGNVLAGSYDGMLCPNPDGYVVAYNQTSEVIDSVNDEYMGKLNTTRYTTTSYLLDSTGNVIYQTECIAIEKDMDSTTYEGEQLVYCNEDRIITVTHNTYWMGMAWSDCTLHLYDMSGNKLAEFEDVMDYGNMINGKMVLYQQNTICVIDKNGQTLAVLEGLWDQHDELMEFDSIASGHHTAFFANGYVGMHSYSNRSLLVSEDMKKTYVLNRSYLYDKTNYGTLVFSKVVRDGAVSDEYYLLDISKCQVDGEGVVIPSENAIVCSTPVTYGSFYNIFGDVEKYALISTSDGRWGYVSYDGQTVKLYDDASAFSGGYAAVKDGEIFYVIDENFNRISNALTGYESVSASGKCVFQLKNGDRYVIAVCNK